MSPQEALVNYVRHIKKEFEHYLPNLELTDAGYRWKSEEEGFDGVINDLRKPLLDTIDEQFSNRISPNGSYIGATGGTIELSEDDVISFGVGPGEKDSFGWLTGRISISYEVNGNTLYEYIYFG